MDTILSIGLYVLAFYAVLLVAGLLWYLKIGRHREIKVNFEEIVSSLFRNGKVRDPHILRNGKWVKTDKTSQDHSPDF